MKASRLMNSNRPLLPSDHPRSKNGGLGESGEILVGPGSQPGLTKLDCGQHGVLELPSALAMKLMSDLRYKDRVRKQMLEDDRPSSFA